MHHPHLTSMAGNSPSTAKTPLSPFEDSELEGHQNATKPCQIFLDRVEHDNRSKMALESLDLVVGVDHHRRLKIAIRRRRCSPPPRPFSGSDELRDLLGFEEEEETILTPQESHQKVAGVGRKLRSKFGRRRRCLAADRRRPPLPRRRTTTRLKRSTRRFQPHRPRRHSSPETPSTAGQSCRGCLGLIWKMMNSAVDQL